MFWFWYSTDMFVSFVARVKKKKNLETSSKVLKYNLELRRSSPVETMWKNVNIQAEQEHWALPTPEPEYPGYPGSRIVYTLHPRLGDNSSHLEPRARVLYLLQVTTCTIQCTVWVNVRFKGLVCSVLFTVGVSVRSIGLVCTVLCTVWVNVRSVGLVCTVQCTV